MEIAVNFQIKKKISLTAAYSQHFTKSSKTQIIGQDSCFWVERKISIVSPS